MECLKPPIKDRCTIFGFVCARGHLSLFSRYGPVYLTGFGVHVDGHSYGSKRFRSGTWLP